jgi:hypothetical protein
MTATALPAAAFAYQERLTGRRYAILKIADPNGPYLSAKTMRRYSLRKIYAA